MLMRRTSAHTGANTGRGFSQLLSQAFQASKSRSSLRPGSSLHGTGCQRLRGWAMGGGSAVIVVDSVTTAGGAWELAGTCGTCAQAAVIPTINAWTHTVHFFQPGSRVMGLILLEALGALVLLVLIVWWTMFSGRKKGEINTDAPDERPTKPPN
jgi:hypothetical protein